VDNCEPNFAAGFIAYSNAMQKADNLLIKLEIGLAAESFKEKIEGPIGYLDWRCSRFNFELSSREECLALGYTFDILTKPEVRKNPVFKLTQLLQKNWSQFKLRYHSSPLDESWVDLRESNERWKHINKELLDIFGDESLAENDLNSRWSDLWNKVSHDALGFAFLVGLFAFFASYAADSLRKRDLILGKSARNILAIALRRRNSRLASAMEVFQSAQTKDFFDEILETSKNGLDPAGLGRLETFRQGLPEEQRVVFDALSCLAIEPTLETRSVFMRVLNLVPFLSLLLTRDLPEHSQRQKMNQDILRLIQSFRGDDSGNFSTDISRILTLVKANFGDLEGLSKLSVNFKGNISPEDFYKQLEEILKNNALAVSQNKDTDNQTEVPLEDLEARIKHAYAKMPRLSADQMYTYNPRPNNRRTRNLGGNDEFYELSDYQEGDSSDTIDWNATARLGRPMARVYTRNVTEQASFLVDLRDVLEPASVDKWVEDFSKSLVAVFSPERMRGKHYKLEKMIFIMPDGNIEVSPGASVKQGLQQVLKLLNRKIKQAQEIARTIPARNYPLRFYDQFQNDRYSQRIAGVFSADAKVISNLGGVAPWEDLQKQSLFYIGGSNQGQQEMISKVFQRTKTTVFFWKQNQATALRQRVASSALADSSSAVKNDVSVVSAQQQPLGGINFCSLPIVVQKEAMLAVFNNNSVLIPLSQLDQEWAEITKLSSCRITPSCQRLKDYLQSCFQKDDVTSDIDKVLGCLGEMMRQDEDEVRVTDNAVVELLAALER